MRKICNTILGMEELRKMFTRVILTPKPVEEMDAQSCHASLHLNATMPMSRAEVYPAELRVCRRLWKISPESCSKGIYNNSERTRYKVYHIQKNVFRGVVSEGTEFVMVHVRSPTSQLCYKRDFNWWTYVSQEISKTEMNQGMTFLYSGNAHITNLSYFS